MATVAELKAVLKDTLEKRGALAQIKARIRAEVFSALEDQSEPRPTLSRENLLINELIREYLEYNKYKYTASVLTAESGQPEVPLDRQFLAKELNIVEDASGKSVFRMPNMRLFSDILQTNTAFCQHCGILQTVPLCTKTQLSYQYSLQKTTFEFLP
ncbi:centrosomal protein 20 isoform X3 [Pyrgilauda ruficollis]|uniref:centrosomal protein 20 isoform X3 n=1 Tax=Pyrgilauda ruficollis TaxID=221976 RepID=UPI001B8816C4|nr:centrosomal protein 20 isoform X3 [Pyrgilauda ruficollis]